MFESDYSVVIKTVLHYIRHDKIGAIRLKRQLFQMTQQSLNRNDLIDMETFLNEEDINRIVRARFRLPSNEEIMDCILYLDIDADDLYLNTNNPLHPYCYFDELYAYVTLEALDVETNEMTQTKKRIEMMRKQLKTFKESQKWNLYFAFVDKPARILAFIGMFQDGDIPEEQALEAFVQVYTSSEFGLSAFDHELLLYLYQDCRSPEHAKRMNQFYEKVGERDWITVYRGCTEEGIEAYSWTFDKRVAEKFALRSDGDVYQVSLLKEHVLDYFEHRKEEEVLVSKDHIENVQKIQTKERLS